jgi:hypothetical protein
LSIVRTIPSGNELEEAELKEKLGELTLTRGDALPLLWSYLWGQDGNQDKGKLKTEQTYADLTDGTLEQAVDDRLLRLTFLVLSIASTNTFNLFTLRQHLPDLVPFLLIRLYGRPKRRKYEITFPPRDDWCDDLPDEEDALLWRAPEEPLRSTYLALLRRLLDGGVDQQIVWRLFSLVKQYPHAAPTSTAQTSGAVTPSLEGSNPLDQPRPASTTRATPRKRPKPGLHISTTMRPADEEKLQPEILDLLRHAMKARWPGVFVLRDASAGAGLELADMGRPWPQGPKGFNFSVSCHYGARLTMSAGCTSQSSTTL